MRGSRAISPSSLVEPTGQADPHEDRPANRESRLVLAK